jgi:hypothetical protein
MDAVQQYMFDLNGYLVLRGVLPQDLLERCERALDRIESMDPSEYPPPVTLGRPRTSGELYVSNILEADPIFQELIDRPDVLDVIGEVTNGPFRLNHTFAIFRYRQGFTPLHNNGTPVIPQCEYQFRNGRMMSSMTKVAFSMRDCAFEDGCFGVIPGSHKSNYPRPWGTDPRENPAFVPLETRAGDAIVFTEALCHGAAFKQTLLPRRTVFFTYSVGHMADWPWQGMRFSAHIGNLSERRREIIQVK